MPSYDVYLEVAANVFGTTRDVFTPYPANPVSAPTDREAVAHVATNLQQTYGDLAIGTYAVIPSGQTTAHTVTGFSQTPIFSS